MIALKTKELFIIYLDLKEKKNTLIRTCFFDC